MDESKHFMLYTCCFPVAGHQKGIIIDSQRGAFIDVPLELVDILQDAADYTLKQLINTQYPQFRKGILAFFEKLIELEYGFLTSEPERFPPIDMVWMSPFPLSVAYIEYHETSSFSLTSLFHLLNQQACEMIQLRLFGFPNLAKLDLALEQLSDSRVKRIELLINFEHYATLRQEFTELMNRHLRISNLMVFDSPEENQEEKIKHLKFAMRPGSYLEEIGNRSFLAFLDHYTESLFFNTGLHRKIAIDLDGHIRNHPAHKRSFGQIQDFESLTELLQSEDFLQQQLITKAQINKCKVCQYRNICHSVSELVPENKGYKMLHECRFDPWKNQWHREESKMTKPPHSILNDSKHN